MESRRESLESQEKETPDISRDPSTCGDLDNAGPDGGLEAQRVPTNITYRDKEGGAPLEISPSHLSQPPQPGIPNGGFTAWLQVLCGFFLFFNSWGLINAFGVFQSYYTHTLLPTSSNSSISWIGSLQAFLLCCCTIFTGPLFDRGHALLLVRAGSLLVVFGLMMTSLCSAYWQLMLAQGLCVGVGGGCLFIVSVAIIPSYFTTKRAFAIGLAASGSSLGGVIYPIVFHTLQPRLGFGWSTRIIAFLALATLIIPSLCIKVRALPARRKKIIDFSGFAELPFCLFSLAAFIGFLGLYIPFFYISEFASPSSSTDNLGSNIAFYLLPILSSGSIAGRICPSYIADFLGPLNVLSLCTLVAGLLGFCWIAVQHTLPGTIIWALLYGAFSGAFVSLQPSTVVSITDDMGVVGGRLGMNTFCAALGILIGNPVAGILLSKAGWVGLQVFCGGTLAVGAGLVGVTRWSRVGLEVRRKA